MNQPKYTLRGIEQIQDRCCALSFWCSNEECDYRYDKDDRTTDVCPKCGTLRRVCGRYPIKGRKRCAKHGGKTPMGIASSQYRGRGISKNLPTRLLEHYELAIANKEAGEILEMLSDIELLETRKSDLVSRLDAEGSAAIWSDARKVFEQFKKARVKATNGNKLAGRQMAEHLDTLEGLLIRGYGDAAIWSEIAEIMERQRKLRESELRRRKEASEIVTKEEVATLVGRIFSIIETRVLDQNVRAAILNDMKALFV